MPLLPPNRNYQGVLLPNATAPKYDRAFAQGNRVFHSRENLVLHPQNGTPDPTFDPETAFTYLGAFRVPYSSQGGDAISTRDMESFAVDTSTNTIFMGKHNLISQFSIPELSMADVAQDLNPSQRLQNFATYLDKADAPDDHGGDGYGRLGWMKFVGGRLILSGYHYYDTDPINNKNILIIDDPYNLQTSVAKGWLATDHGDWGASYAIEIPQEKRALFGNNSHFIGTGAHLAIIGRASLGHSLVGVDLESLTLSSASAPSQLYAHYPTINPIEGYSNYNPSVLDHYSALIKPAELTWEDFLDMPPDSRVNDLEYYPQPDPSLYKNLMMFAGWYPAGFIPNGSDSVVFLGKNAMTRYGGTYKTRNLEHAGGKAGGPAPISATDIDNMVWTMNLSDVANATNTHDPKYSYCGVFDNNRWLLYSQEKNRSVSGGTILSADYDKSTSKLYVMHGNIPMDGNVYNNGRIVAVYQVGGL